jgi:hypothetical protein
MMIKRAALIFLAAATLVLGADATGKWSGEMKGPDGQSWTTSFELKSEGSNLTGKMIGGDGQFEKAIENGKVEGDNISFTVHLDFGDGVELSYKGKVEADKISFKVQRKGDDTPRDFVVKKV